MSKAGATVILRSLLNWEIDVESLPWGPEDESVQAGIETIMEATEIRGKGGRKVVEADELKRENQEDVVIIKDEPDD